MGGGRKGGGAINSQQNITTGIDEQQNQRGKRFSAKLISDWIEAKVNGVANGNGSEGLMTQWPLDPTTLARLHMETRLKVDTFIWTTTALLLTFFIQII